MKERKDVERDPQRHTKILRTKVGICALKKKIPLAFTQ